MNNIKNENGAITLIVTVTVLFIIAFLISSYTIVANKAQIQAEAIEAIKAIFGKNNDETSKENLYNGYFGGNIIPIYTAEQLIKIGTNQDILVKELNENNELIYCKYHHFGLNDASNTYIYTLMNDITFDVDTYTTELGGADWTPLGEIANINYEGNGKIITVTKLNNTTVVYKNSNNYSN